MAQNTSGIDRDWSSVSIEMAAQILRQGELFLQAQLQAGIAADQRAAQTGGIFTTLSTAVLASTLAYSAMTGSQQKLVAAGISTFFVMLLGAAVALYSARPTKFYFVGNHPEKWFSVAEQTSLANELMGEAENYQDRIEVNARILRENGELLKWANRLVVLAPVAGFSTWLFWS